MRYCRCSSQENCSADDKDDGGLEGGKSGTPVSREGENDTPEAKFINVESRLGWANELSMRKGKENVGSMKKLGG